jgi:hypothetical protein
MRKKVRWEKKGGEDEMKVRGFVCMTNNNESLLAED